MEEVLTDRATSGFSNFITFSQNFEALRGLYACAPIVVVTGPDQTATPDLLEGRSTIIIDYTVYDKCKT